MTASNPGGLGGSATGAGAATGAGTARSSQEPGAAGLERAIARLLTVGTYASIFLLTVGVGLMVVDGIGPLAGGPAFDLTRLGPARVAASLIGYARGGERAMAGIAALILLVIAASVGLAQALEG